MNAFDTSNDAPGIVLTGATGFLGGEVLARLLERDNRTIYVLIRARDHAEADKRLRQTIVGLLGRAEPWMHRTVAIAADLERADMGLDGWQRQWLAERAEWIIHCAASVSFTLGLADSRRINVEGTRRMVELAQLADALGGLRCLPPPLGLRFVQPVEQALEQLGNRSEGGQQLHLMDLVAFTRP